LALLAESGKSGRLRAYAIIGKLQLQTIEPGFDNLHSFVSACVSEALVQLRPAELRRSMPGE